MDQNWIACGRRQGLAGPDRTPAYKDRLWAPLARVKPYLHDPGCVPHGLGGVDCGATVLLLKANTRTRSFIGHLEDDARCLKCAAHRLDVIDRAATRPDRTFHPPDCRQ